MMKILVPINGSRNSYFVVPYLIREFHKNRALKIHLLNVQPRFPAHIARFVFRKALDDFQRERGERALLPAQKALDGFGVPCTTSIEVGEAAKLITAAARRLGCDHIVMSTPRKNSLDRMIDDSFTNQVFELTGVPVEVIAGETVSKIGRYGIPAGIGAALAMGFLAAAD